MWLINVDTRELEEFMGDRIPEYAILSHTWGEEEVTFQDVRTRSAEYKAAWVKVNSCCGRAKLDGFQYCWIDTCWQVVKGPLPQ
jgi:hypothetical protein